MTKLATTKKVPDVCNEKSAVYTPNQLNTLQTYEIFNGIYRINNKKIGSFKNGKQYAHIELHDATGTKIGQCTTEAIEWYQNKPFQLVNVRAFVLDTDVKKIVHIVEIQSVKAVDTIDPILRLPKALCASSSLLARLINFRQSIQSPALGQFIDTVFSDDEFALAFLQVPASKKHHHNQDSGLLIHSLEVTETIGIQSFRNNDEREIAMVAGLFHDIGKVKTLNTDIRHTRLGKMVSHDDLTLEVCAKALRLLDKSWPDASSTLRHAWTCKSGGSRYGFHQNCPIASIVQFADKLSADLFDEKIAFQKENKTVGLAWSENKYLWRPSPEHATKVRRRFYA